MKTVFERIEELELTLWSARKHIKKLDEDFVSDYLHDSKMVLVDGETEKCFTVSDVKDMLRDAMVQMSDWKNEGHTTPSLEPLMDKWIENKIR
jgi:hypothetical protein